MGSAPLRLALVGIGKIARDQHLPALARGDGVELVAAVNRDGPVTQLATFPDIPSLLASGIRVDAVSLCTPPAGRHELASTALEAGLHVMLEKPPAASVAEVDDLAQRARRRGKTLFTTWHSREASGVEPARAWLSQRSIASVQVTWKEDIRVWHPGQHWILQAGGMGVFDPGINALSILTRLLPGVLKLQSASLSVPSNCQSPLAAEIVWSHGQTRVAASFDFLYAGAPRWDIEVRTDAEMLLLTDGGHRLYIDGTPQVAGRNEEYARLYHRFAELISTGTSDVDTTPLQLVTDAFRFGQRQASAPFHF
ncbi:Gfo/Idh/MocA family protein [Steroidobacter sp.]|uniref:Gfo/Idh/MocA family protein n=1 Tax=Steroidobacter sp. TaxID=1978227 RepID=UPI001A5351A9|nr:Gfo/Idh/MocA family oxidoreductase [Steroidobacter sp.]MBL8270174.1 Gfo/Idh/MocA family oxidoreductase [Steroidobacter sp.]